MNIELKSLSGGYSPDSEGRTVVIDGQVFCRILKSRTHYDLHIEALSDYDKDNPTNEDYMRILNQVFTKRVEFRTDEQIKQDKDDAYFDEEYR